MMPKFTVHKIDNFDMPYKWPKPKYKIGDYVYWTAEAGIMEDGACSGTGKIKGLYLQNYIGNETGKLGKCWWNYIIEPCTGWNPGTEIFILSDEEIKVICLDVA